ncbi:MAG: hypothetical protein LBF59_00525 [Prevotellaceae bacterium]|nr:hypothetical protein [Prevotellaceae bacterium]
MKIEDLYDEIEVPAGLEARLDTLIDSLAETEKRVKRKIKLRLWTGSIAASIIIALSVGLLLKPANQPDTFSVLASSDLRQIDDPETAYKEIKKALELMSTNLNKGFDEFNIVFANEIEKSNEIINKTLIKY